MDDWTSCCLSLNTYCAAMSSLTTTAVKRSYTRYEVHDVLLSPLLYVDTPRYETVSAEDAGGNKS